MGRLELTVPDGKAASARAEGLGEVWCLVTGGRVAKIPGGEALGKWRVMWGWRLEYLIVRLWVSTENKLGNSRPA